MSTGEKDAPQPALPDSLRSLPPFPGVAIKAVKALEQQDFDPRAVEQILASDAVFTSDLLYCANSAYFGFSSRVATIRHASVLIGRDHLRSLILATALRSFAKSPLAAHRYRLWWHHSVTTALLAKGLVEANAIFLPGAYTAGLLHDVGRLILMVGAAREYTNYLHAVEDSPLDISEIEFETAVFGMDHCQLGALILDEWGFPAEIIRAAEGHHGAVEWPADPACGFAGLACRLATALGFEALKRRQSRTVEDILEEIPASLRQSFPRIDDTVRAALAEKVASLDGTKSGAG